MCWVSAACAAGQTRGWQKAVIDRTFAAVVLDWGIAVVPDRRASLRAVRRRVEALCADGVHIAVVGGTGCAAVDGRLRARPSGPGRLLLGLNRGSELFEVKADGPHLLRRRVASKAEIAALDCVAAGSWLARWPVVGSMSVSSPPSGIAARSTWSRNRHGTAQRRPGSASCVP